MNRLMYFLVHRTVRAFSVLRAATPSQHVWRISGLLSACAVIVMIQWQPLFRLAAEESLDFSVVANGTVAYPIIGTVILLGFALFQTMYPNSGMGLAFILLIVLALWISGPLTWVESLIGAVFLGIAHACWALAAQGEYVTAVSAKARASIVRSLGAVLALFAIFVALIGVPVWIFGGVGGGSILVLVTTLVVVGVALALIPRDYDDPRDLF